MPAIPVVLKVDQGVAVVDFDIQKTQSGEAEEAGNQALSDVIARAVAADIDFWFRRYLVGPQEPLVDVPHLLMRFPFLLDKRADKIEEWNKVIGIDAPPYGLEKELYEAHLAGQEFGYDYWVPNACFWWPKLKNDEKLNEHFFEAKEGDWADVVFCEDCSEFRERSPKSGEAPAEFSADFDGPWERRHVADLASKRYSPLSRFAI